MSMKRGKFYLIEVHIHSTSQLQYPKDQQRIHPKRWKIQIQLIIVNQIIYSLEYELPKIQNAEFEQTDSADDNKERIRISEDVSETIPQEKYNLPDIDNQAQENEKEAKKDRQKSKHRKHKHRKEKKEKKDKRAKADNDYEDDEFEQDAE